MRLVDPCLGRVVAAVPPRLLLGVPLLDEYLEFVAAGSR
jgi:hypothetical protein